MTKRGILLLFIASGFIALVCDGCSGPQAMLATQGYPLGPCNGTSCAQYQSLDPHCLAAPTCMQSMCRQKLLSGAQCFSGTTNNGKTCDATICDWQ